MLVGDLLNNDGFDFNANYEIYDCTDRTVQWADAGEPIYSTAKNGYDTPPCRILDMEIVYVTINIKHHALVIEAVKQSGRE